MKKIVIKIICSFVVMFLIAGITTIFPIIKSGYNMYKTAVSDNQLTAVVEEIKMDDGYIKIEEVSPEFIKQLLTSEDKRFYNHNGFDLIATMRAAVNNIKLGYFAQGGSTVTQQLAKNLYFSFDKNFERKIAEVFSAFDIERMFTKEEILELYINVVYYGEGCYGLKEASEYYYNIDPLNMTSEQCAALVYTIKSPNKYNPNVYKMVG